MKGVVIFLVLFIVGSLVFVLFANFWDSTPNDFNATNYTMSYYSVKLLFEPESVDFDFYYEDNISLNISGKGFNKPGVVDIVSLPRTKIFFVVEHEGFYDLDFVCDLTSDDECFFKPEPVGGVKFFYSNSTNNLRMIVDGGVVGGALFCIGYRDFSSFKLNFSKIVPPKMYASDYDFCHEFNNLTPGFYDWEVGGVQNAGEFWLLFDFLDSSEMTVINNFKY